MELIPYLHQLLYQHDCVIVPGLGGFVCAHKKGEFNAAAGFIQPARKTVAFNQNLTNNDGLLANHISQGENISFARATELLTEAADKIRWHLNNGITVNLNGIGSLYLNEENKLVFVPDPATNFLQESYGLPLLKLGKTVTAPAEPEKEKGRQPKAAQAATPNLKRPGKNRVAKAFRRAATFIFTLIILFALFILQDFVFHSKFQKGSLVPYGLYSDSEETPVKAPIAIQEPLATDTETFETQPESLEKNTVAQSHVETSLTPQVNSDSLFYIIAGAFKYEKNAQTFEQQLQDKGHSPYIIKLPGSSLYRVGYRRYTSRTDAEAQLNGIREQENNAAAWVLAVKK